MQIVISTCSRIKVYHRPGCRYAKMIEKRTACPEEKEWVEIRGYRPCKWCFSTAGSYQIKKANAIDFLSSNGLFLDEKDHKIYIRSDVGCWKVVYSKKQECFLLYHRNHSEGIVPLSEVENDQYHNQSDHFQFNSIMGAAQYIVKHDKAKKLLSIGSYKDLPRRTKKEKKYYKAEKNKAHRNNAHRINDLFQQIENGSGSFE